MAKAKPEDEVTPAILKTMLGWHAVTASETVSVGGVVDPLGYGELWNPTDHYVDPSVWTTLKNGLWQETFIDLSGYQLDDKVLIPAQVEIQQAAPFQLGMVSQGFRWMLEWNFITSKPLSKGNYSNKFRSFMESLFIQSTGAGTTQAPLPVGGPSFQESVDDWDGIIYGRYRLHGPFNQQIQQQGSYDYLQTYYSTEYGSGSPTASDRLYCYRILMTDFKAEGDDWHIPSVRYVIASLVHKPGKLPYMQTLKRSYELNQVGISE